MTHTNRGLPPPRFHECGYATLTDSATACLRNAIALTGARDEHIYTLYTAILDEINYAFQSFNSYLDDALEEVAIAANATLYGEAGLNDPEPKLFAEAMSRLDGKRWNETTLPFNFVQ